MSPSSPPPPGDTVTVAEADWNTLVKVSGQHPWSQLHLVVVDDGGGDSVQQLVSMERPARFRFTLG